MVSKRASGRYVLAAIAAAVIAFALAALRVPPITGHFSAWDAGIIIIGCVVGNMMRRSGKRLLGTAHIPTATLLLVSAALGVVLLPFSSPLRTLSPFLAAIGVAWLTLAVRPRH